MEIEVAIPSPLHQTFTYVFTENIEAGKRVLVPFGARKIIGVSLGAAKKDKAETKSYTLKSVASVVDQKPVYSQASLTLARWISDYYMHPIGEVLKTMLPASTTKTLKSVYQLTTLGQQYLDKFPHIKDPSILANTQLSDTQPDQYMVSFLKALFIRKQTLSAASLKNRFKKISESQSISKELLEQYLYSAQKKKFISLEKENELKTRTSTDILSTHLSKDQKPTSIQIPTEEQQKVIEFFLEYGLNTDAKHEELYTEVTAEQDTTLQKPLKPFLLHGITGSGKTEVYLNVIQKTFDFYRRQKVPTNTEKIACTETEECSGQVLVLVPEISLTPQMTHVFESRFPGRVSVVHSAMNDQTRWQELDRIRSGEAKILIGPRSAVFASFKNLKLIIVDEEHDSSYKQTTGLCYNGRDVAIVRGSLENCCVILGSATPSLESYWNSKIGKYHYLQMKKRVGNRPLPTVETIIAKSASTRGVTISNTTASQTSKIQNNNIQNSNAEEKSRKSKIRTDNLPIDASIIEAINNNKKQGNQAIVLVNRRGYAFYLFDLNKKTPYLCKNCSISMTLHSKSTVLHCHYCDYSISLQEVRSEFPDASFVAVGYGSQKAEDCLNEVLDDCEVLRLDSDVIAKKGVLANALEKFRKHEIDVLVGTQILAKGHDFPKVTLIVILEVDQLLNLPDFRAGEKTFQLLVQAAGRAGRAELPGRVLVQSSRADHPIVEAGLQQDYEKFAENELEFRKRHSYPPFSRMVHIELNSENEKNLEEICEQIINWLGQLENHNNILSLVKILGPSVPSIEIIRKRHRRSILFSSANIPLLRSVVAKFLAKFKKLPKSVRMIVDFDPQSLI